MNWWWRLTICAALSVLDVAYLIEMYRHLTRPLKPLSHESRKKKMRRLQIFFLGASAIIIAAYLIRQFLLPRPVSDLIIASLQIIFVLPFFGAIFTDRLLHAWRQRRLPYPISIGFIVITALIGFGTNALILYASQESISAAARLLDGITDITTLFIILALAFLGIGYLQSTKK